MSRDEVADRLGEVIVVPATRTMRGILTEVALTPEDGMPEACVLNFDHIGILSPTRVGPLVCALPDGKWKDVQRAPRDQRQLLLPV